MYVHSTIFIYYKLTHSIQLKSEPVTINVTIWFKKDKLSILFPQQPFFSVNAYTKLKNKHSSQMTNISQYLFFLLLL